MDLIRMLSKYFGYEFVKIKPIQIKKVFFIKKEIEKLFDALKLADYRLFGSSDTENTRTFAFHTIDKTVLVELSNTDRYKGELIGVYVQVNEVNIDSLITKLTAKNESLQNAKESLNEALRIVIQNKTDKTEIPSPLDNALRQLGSHLNNLE